VAAALAMSLRPEVDFHGNVEHGSFD
jgi:hypothetical protein